MIADYYYYQPIIGFPRTAYSTTAVGSHKPQEHGYSLCRWVQLVPPC